MSKAQAARAIGGYGRVSGQVRERVERAAKKLGHRPNALARSINTGRSATIGVVVGDIQNPYFGLVTRGISDQARERDYDVILASTGEDSERQAKAVSTLLGRQIDGLLICPAAQTDTQTLIEARESGIPVVLFDRRLPDGDFDSVRMDIERTSAELTERVLKRGRRRIAFISSLESAERRHSTRAGITVSTVAERLDGIKDALTRHGITLAPELIKLCGAAPGATRDAVRELLAQEDPPDTILTSDALVGLDALEAIKESELQIPEDLAFAMLDDQPWAALLSPSITAISQPAYELGAHAARLLFERMLNPGDQQTILLETAVMERESTGK